MSVPSPESSSSQLLHWEQPPSTGQGRKTSSHEDSKSYHVPNTTTQRDTHRNLCYWSLELSGVHHTWAGKGKVFYLQLLAESCHQPHNDHRSLNRGSQEDLQGYFI